MSGIVTIAPNDIAELQPEFKIMLQATNRSPRTVWTGHEPVDVTFLVAWIAGDFVVSLTALARTERP
jgi:hypothetical protein